MYAKSNVLRIIATVAVLAAGTAFLVLKWAYDPFNGHGRGPGWECDATRGGAVICDKDVPPQIQKRKP